MNKKMNTAVIVNIIGSIILFFLLGVLAGTSIQRFSRATTSTLVEPAGIELPVDSYSLSKNAEGVADREYIYTGTIQNISAEITIRNTPEIVVKKVKVILYKEK